jgi:hypothetical protein
MTCGLMGAISGEELSAWAVGAKVAGRTIRASTKNAEVSEDEARRDMEPSEADSTQNKS